MRADQHGGGHPNLRSAPLHPRFCVRCVWCFFFGLYEDYLCRSGCGDGREFSFFFCFFFSFSRQCSLPLRPHSAPIQTTQHNELVMDPHPPLHPSLLFFVLCSHCARLLSVLFFLSYELKQPSWPMLTLFLDVYPPPPPRFCISFPSPIPHLHPNLFPPTSLCNSYTPLRLIPAPSLLLFCSK